MATVAEEKLLRGEDEPGEEKTGLLGEEDLASIEGTGSEELKRQIYQNLKSTGLETLVIKSDKGPSKYLYDGQSPPAAAWRAWADRALSIYENPPGENEEVRSKEKAKAAATFISLVELLLKQAERGGLDEELTSVTFELGEYRELMPELQDYLEWRVKITDARAQEERAKHNPAGPGESVAAPKKSAREKRQEERVSKQRQETGDQRSASRVCDYIELGLGLAARAALDEINEKSGGSSYTKVELAKPGKKVTKADLLRIITEWGRVVAERGDALETAQVAEAADALLWRYQEEQGQNLRGVVGLTIEEVQAIIKAWNQAAHRRWHDTGDGYLYKQMEEPSRELKRELGEV
jgi:hypothetical protein